MEGTAEGHVPLGTASACVAEGVLRDIIDWRTGTAQLRFAAVHGFE